MRKAAFAIIGALAVIGCDAGVTQPEVEPQLGTYAADAAEARTYRVTITNLTDSQPLTPPLAFTHARPMNAHKPGRHASEELRQIAENGNLAPAIERLGMIPHVSDVVVAAGDPPPLLQGGSVTFEIGADGHARFFSFVSMLICSNDGFTTRANLLLPYRMGRVKTAYARAYDAGTELNTEDFADLVPPCQIFGATSSEDEGTGMSNPELLEGGRIRHHPGIHGGVDLDPELHGWDGPIAMIQVERIG